MASGAASQSVSRPKVSHLGAVLCVAGLVGLGLVPERYRLAPLWLPAASALIMIGPILATRVSRDRLWITLERYTTICGILLTIAGNGLNLVNVIFLVIFHTSELNATSLFASALTIWGANVLTFTLLYWELDAGGPEARAYGVHHYADFDFPASDASPDKVPANWAPSFADYFFIGFTTATAFSPVEAMPLTARAKLLMVVQSLISLATLSVVAARTINILQ